MDFSQVKSITIPEGEVTKIEVGGATIWEKETEDWGTLTYGSGSTYTIKTSSDFGKLCDSNSPTRSITFSDGTSIRKDTIEGYEFGPNFGNIEDYFLSSCTHLNSAINVPSGVTSIGLGFLNDCTALASQVTIPATVNSVGQFFMTGTQSFTGNLVVNTTATLDYPENSLVVGSSTAPAYVNGVRLVGAGAGIWKNQMPDEASSGRYRKLILG